MFSPFSPSLEFFHFICECFKDRVSLIFLVEQSWTVRPSRTLIDLLPVGEWNPDSRWCLYDDGNQK